MTDIPEFDPREFRRALGNFATGITIITAQNSDGVKVGVTANSFNSVSLEPPLILWSIDKRSNSYEIFDSAGHFAVNVLSADQMDLSNHFARPQDDKFADVEWEEGVKGSPLLPNCAARFQCETHEIVDAGDHWLFIGKVIAFDDLGRSPLCYHQGSYSMIASHPGASQKQEASAAGAFEGRLGENLHYLLLQAIRGYQASYLPRQEALGLSTGEARLVLVLSDNPGSDIEKIVAITGTPQSVIQQELVMLSGRALIIESAGSYSLTEEGAAKASGFWQLADDQAKEVLADLDEEQTKAFKETLRMIAGGVKG